MITLGRMIRLSSLFSKEKKAGHARFRALCQNSTGVLKALLYAPAQGELEVEFADLSGHIAVYTAPAHCFLSTSNSLCLYPFAMVVMKCFKDLLA